MNMHGFELIEEIELPEYRASGIWMRHLATGCEVFHVLNDDEENLFGFVFKTLPSDSTGVAHILEHSVLCGSDRFRVKDPFVMLMRGSLNTFVNAMTYPDKTIYPASSTVPQDLFNIMDVYGDAVFAPLLRREFFRQEGHRLEFTDDGQLDIRGIVYNEMKGNYANHDSLVADWSYRSLLPDTPYGYDSGGDPAVIPDLTYEDFVRFHETFYHPSNTRVFLYGNIPTERYLEFLQTRFLSRFKARPADVTVTRQPRWVRTREHIVPCPADEERITSVTLNWLLDPVTDPSRVLALELLAEILLGTSAAPLRKRLIDSGLGDDLAASTGLETELFEIVFSVGLRGTSAEHSHEIRSAILDELAALVRDGLNPDIVEAAMRKVEFRNRELRGGPNGLRLMGRSLRGWLHGLRPDATLRFEEPFAGLREASSAGSRFFESLIQECLLENLHRSLVTVIPDPELASRERKKLDEQLKDIQAGLGERESEQIRRSQEELLSLQQTPDPPEAVASVPFLKVGDLPTTVTTIDSDRTRIAGVNAFTHDLFTNGIVYVDFVFNVNVPADLAGYLPFLAGTLGEVGLPGKPYDVVATEVALKTGGISGSLDVALPLSSDGTDCRMYVRLKCLESTVGEAIDLLGSILTRSDLQQVDRLSDLWKERRSDLSGSVLPGGSGFAGLRAGRRFSDADRFHELWQGITQLELLSESPDDLSSRLESAHRHVIARDTLLVNITGTDEAMGAAVRHIERLVESLPPKVERAAGSNGAPEYPKVEGLVVPSNVAYVAAAMRGARFGTAEHAHELILAHLLRTGYLWETIRMTGGAYGAGASARGLDSMFGFISYRDPRITETIAAFGAGLERYAGSGVPAEELELAQIGVTGHDIRPLSPAQKGIVALRRELYGVTDELRQEKRDAVLRAGPADIRRAADRLHDTMKDASIAVLAGRDALERAAESHPGLVENQVVVPL